MYFVIDNAPKPSAALKVYCQLADQWVASVLSAGETAKSFPIQADRTIENALSLRKRTEFIRKEIIPLIEQ